jgi:hypothetical protein
VHLLVFVILLVKSGPIGMEMSVTYASLVALLRHMKSRLLHFIVISDLFLYSGVVYHFLS